MKYKLILIVVFIISLLLIHRLDPQSPFVNWLFIQNQSGLEVELIGSGVLALLIGLLLFSHQENLRETQNKERSRRFFEKIVVTALKNAFDRSYSSLNTFSSFNSKAYFDNTSLNNIHDVVEKYQEPILEFIDYHSKNKLASILIKFYDDIQEGYRRGEELDILLNKMANAVYVDNIQVIYLKGLRYSGFKENELKVLLFNPTMNNNLYDFYDKFYNNPDTDEKLSYKEKFLSLNLLMKKKIKKLKQNIRDIKNLI